MIDQLISIPWLLSFVTLVIVLGIGFWQLKRVRGSQAKRGEHPGGIAGPE
jgi:cytochrome oxidase assembly protein ShyY1